VRRALSSPAANGGDDMTTSNILEIAEWSVALRREIHRHPELGFEEVRTAVSNTGASQRPASSA
jgi:hypothetical protein